jgi:hypothetical protein
VIRDLGEGLVLRTATMADAEPLAAFVGDVLRPQDSDTPSAPLTAWTRDLLEGRHPSFAPEDATVVVDSRTGAVVSCLYLISQTWATVACPSPWASPS